jgi:hypothetical protein
MLQRKIQGQKHSLNSLIIQPQQIFTPICPADRLGQPIRTGTDQMADLQKPLLCRDKVSNQYNYCLFQNINLGFYVVGPLDSLSHNDTDQKCRIG